MKGLRASGRVMFAAGIVVAVGSFNDRPLWQFLTGLAMVALGAVLGWDDE